MQSDMVQIGQLLIAEPFMLDPNFRRAVVLLCEHSGDDGTIGFILNKPLKMKLNEIIEEFPEFEAEIYFGGPVATDTIHYLHNVGDLLDESVEIVKGVHWGGNFEKLKFLIESQLILPKNIKFFVGYSGWSTGQLTDELDYGSWVLGDMHPNYAFKSRSQLLWRQVLKNKGDSYSVISQIPDSLNLN